MKKKKYAIETKQWQQERKCGQCNDWFTTFFRLKKSGDPFACAMCFLENLMADEVKVEATVYVR